MIKDIAPVPSSADFIDVVLQGTMRRTPTVIHKNFKVSPCSHEQQTPGACR
jgi:nucleolar GTP-binding protein